MKKLIPPILILSLTLAACGTAQATGASESAAPTLPPLTQVVIGTFKLEGTDQAVTAAQAAGLLADGRSNREIADALFLAEGTVKNLVTSVLSKLQVRDRTQAAIRARELGIL